MILTTPLQRFINLVVDWREYWRNEFGGARVFFTLFVIRFGGRSDSASIIQVEHAQIIGVSVLTGYAYAGVVSALI